MNNKYEKTYGLQYYFTKINPVVKNMNGESRNVDKMIKDKYAY